VPVRGGAVVSARQRLPDRRPSENFSFELNGLRFTATVGRFEDGRISELFLNNHKFGNQSDTNARDAAILLSFALQHGADIEAIRRALCRDSQGRALGPIGEVLDLIARRP
jgi:ribonucleoside-diphosphate reductase alpha chain